VSAAFDQSTEMGEVETGAQPVYRPRAPAAAGAARGGIRPRAAVAKEKEEAGEGEEEEEEEEEEEPRVRATVETAACNLPPLSAWGTTVVGSGAGGAPRVGCGSGAAGAGGVRACNPFGDGEVLPGVI